MLTPKGPKVIEYNCRFGDPETQIVLPLLKTDLLTIMRAVEEGRLGEINVEFEEGAACCVVVASKGYPGKYATGCPIAIDEAKLGDAVILTMPVPSWLTVSWLPRAAASSASPPRALISSAHPGRLCCR